MLLCYVTPYPVIFSAIVKIEEEQPIRHKNTLLCQEKFTIQNLIKISVFIRKHFLQLLQKKQHCSYYYTLYKT